MTTPYPPAVEPYLVDGALGFWEIADVIPDDVAVVAAEGDCVTYGALRRSSDSISHELLDLGFKPGDVVASLFPNTPSALAVQLATAQLGLVLTPLNWHQTPTEVAYVLRDSGARALFVSAELSEFATEVVRNAPVGRDRQFVDVGELDGFRCLDSLRDRGPVPPAARVMGQSMYYTSGTTGQPKGVLRPSSSKSPEAVLAVRHPLMSRRIGWPAGRGVHLVMAPLYHSGPNNHAFSALQRGYQIVLMKKWDPEAALALIERHRVTSTFMVPTMFHRLLTLRDDVRTSYDTSSLTFVVHGAAPCPAHEKRAMIEWWGPVINELYSSTEGGATTVTATEWLSHPGTVGRVWEGAELKILHETGCEAATGQVGLIYFRNPEPFRYHNDPEKTAASYHDGWFTAGDLGHVDEDGWLYLADRRSDLIISGGVNIYPAEIEAALLEHPGVADAAVVGLPDETWGSRVHAVVQPVDGVAEDGLESQLMSHLAGRLASFKTPRSIEFRQLPRTNTGKLNRSALRDVVLVTGPDGSPG